MESRHRTDPDMRLQTLPQSTQSAVDIPTASRRHQLATRLCNYFLIPTMAVQSVLDDFSYYIQVVWIFKVVDSTPGQVTIARVVGRRIHLCRTACDPMWQVRLRSSEMGFL